MFNDIDEAMEYMASTFIDQPYLLTGNSPRHGNHTVVVSGNGEMWDPHPSRKGLSGPCLDDDSRFFFIEIFTKVFN